METTSTSIVQDLDLLRKLFSIIRESESQTTGMTCTAFEEYLLKKLRDKKYNVRQLDQTEHLSNPTNLFVASDLLKIEIDCSNGIWLYRIMY